MKLLASVVKTLRVLETFSAERQELSTIELSKLLGMDKSSVSRIVVTLQHHGYLIKNSLNGKYRLGAKFIDLGNQVLNRYDELDIGEIAAPFLRRLSDTVKEVVHLGILDNQDVVTLKKMNGGQIVTVDTKVGGRYPAYACALGKVLLAGLSEEKRRQARARSDSTMRTAFGVFGVIAGLLLAIALLVHLYYAEFTYLTAPIFVGIGVLLLFFMMWYDEERIKTRHGEIRIER